MAKTPRKRSAQTKAVLIGLGLDSDGHKRVTTGPNFLLSGGTKETHEEMTEKVIKMNEKLTARGKNLDTVGEGEFADIAHEVGLRRLNPGEGKHGAE